MIEDGAAALEPISSSSSPIWLVEDSPLEAEIAKRALSDFNVEVLSDGPAMLERRSTHGSPSILILDGQLPTLSGLEICKFLRASVDAVTLPILMLTVQGNKADIVEALSAGANDYVTKPYDAAELVARVRGLARMRRLYDELQNERRRLKDVDQERERLLTYANDGWARAEEANRVKDDFLAVVSHELRTPLGAILGWIGLLKAGALSAERTKHALDVIERNARSQNQLIDDLLDVSRILSGKLHVQMERVQLDELVRLAYETVLPSAETKGVALAIDVGPGLYEVMGDSTRLEQIVSNLLTNAIKFTPAGGSVRIVVESGERISLRVIDTGRGIAPDLLPFIFDRFRQGEGSMTRRYGGLGLGLAIVKHLVRIHGGSIRAESAGEGQGATFTIEMGPAKQLTASRSGGAPNVRRVEEERPLEDLAVLVVEDDADWRDMLSQLLSSAGARLRVVSNAAAAIRAIDEERPDVVLSDVAMPDEDGFSLIKRIRSRPVQAGGQTPAVALTACARDEDRASALRAGFDVHLSKPFEHEELLAVIERLGRGRN